MRIKILLPMLLAALAGSARADEKLPVLQVGSEIFSNVTITSISSTDINFIYAGGMANAKIKNLSPELQKHFGFDPMKAQAEELKQVERNAEYHAQLIHQAAVRPPDMTRQQPVPAANTSEPLWSIGLSGVLKQAQADNKLVLLDFTGSDWCPWCIKFDHDVLATESFTAYARQKLELVKVDFPRHTPESDELKQANAALAKQFGVDGYPTYVLLNSGGKELGRQVGYLEGGPDAFISELDGFSKR